MMNARGQHQESTLLEGEAHVWRIALSRALGSDAGLNACLSTEERARLERQRTPDAERRFGVTRLALRHILAHYTGVTAAAVELVVDASGKPRLAGEYGVHFSLSHAGPLALVGVARTDIGIDVERVREPRRLFATARRVLHAETAALLERLPDRQRQLVFLDAWTQRESHVKAVGGGIFITPDVLPFDAEQAADGEPHYRRDRIDQEEWTIVRFLPAEDARASLVARGRLQRVKHFDWKMAAASEGETP